MLDVTFKGVANLKEENVEKEKEKKEAEEKKKQAEVEKKKAEELKAAAELEKQEAEKNTLKYVMNNRLDATKQEIKNQSEIPITELGIAPAPAIKPVTVLEDPQKGRFGGKAVNNGRQLKAEVKPANIPNFYNVIICVESLDPAANPLTDEVIFYIHDSFNPSVYPITPKEFTDGKAMDDEIISFGAFTVGAVADKGQTLLELDLAEQPEFPQQFRDR